jgi:hypothetical protein
VEIGPVNGEHKMFRQLSEKDKAALTDLTVRGYARSKIAKCLKTKIDTLEKLCEENSIPLPKKGAGTFIKDSVDGVFVVKGRKIYFRNSSELYYLLSCESDPRVKTIEEFQDTFKAVLQDDGIIIPSIAYQKVTFKMVENTVEQHKIKFFDAYYNSKFKINYTL